MGCKVSAERAMEILVAINAIRRNGHFVFVEGGHSADYVNLREAYAFPLENSELALGIAERIMDWGVETVVGAPNGATGLTELVGLHLSTLTASRVHAICPVKDGQQFVMPDWCKPYIAGKNCVVIEDTSSTGATVRKVATVLEQCGGSTIGAACICSRGITNRELLGLQEFTSVVEVHYPVYAVEECVLCADATPVRTDLGHGSEFLRFLATGRERTTAAYLAWRKESAA